MLTGTVPPVVRAVGPEARGGPAPCLPSGSPTGTTKRPSDPEGRCRPVAVSATAHFRPEDASPSITRRCSTMNRTSTGAIAIRLAAMSRG